MSGLVRAGRAASWVDADIELRIVEVEQELIDGTIVFGWAYAPISGRPRIPGAPLRVRAGDRVRVRVRNESFLPHGFEVHGVPGSRIDHLWPGEDAEVTFMADVPGTYMYADPVNDPVNRVLGLHGAFVVDAVDGFTAAKGNPMPYARDQATPLVEALFDALGDPHGPFPGSSWIYDPPHRERIWVFTQIDPAFNARAARGETIPPAEMLEHFTPRYFTLNGLSGFDSAHDHDTVPTARIGEPTLLRVINAGLTAHGPHIHGNHIYELATADLTPVDNTAKGVVVHTNVLWLDTWSMPRGGRKDVLLPYMVPPDIPRAVWPPKEEPFPLKYPMHCHIEMSQSAGGGGYPMGCVTDWDIEGLFGDTHTLTHHG